MYTFILKFHSGWAYLALLLLVVAIVNSVAGIVRNKEFSANDRKMGMFAMVFTHIQLLIGLILYFVSPKGYALIGQVGMGTVMKTAELRLTVIEHPITNIIAIMCITIGWSKHKKATSSAAKFKSIAIFYAIGLILLLSRIPWQNWLQ
jgi:hypothetical protein